MSIKALPEDVINRIKSSSTITSLNGVICELAKNSLDAGATKINISVDYSQGNCSAEDNGEGIPPDEFKEAGGLLKLHHSSRFPPEPEFHGSNGAFLASLAVLCLLSITSHHCEYQSHNTISVHNSTVLVRNTPSLPEQRLLTFSHGTRVVVRDLFGSMPVRVKQRAVAAEKNYVDKEWDRLVRSIAGFLLAWPNGASFFIRELTNHREVRLRTTGHESEFFRHQSALAERISRVFIQASLSDSSDSKSWDAISASSGSLVLNGAISLNPVATRRSQLISLGILPVTHESSSNVLYEEVNRIFAASNFALDERSNTSADSKPKKGVDRWPMFYFKIDDSKDAHRKRRWNVDDVLDDRDRSLGSIVSLLKIVCYDFLKKHDFHPLTTDFPSRKTSSSSSPSPSHTPSNLKNVSAEERRIRLMGERSSPYDLWPTVKNGRPMQAPSKDAGFAHSSLAGDSGGRKTPNMPRKSGQLGVKPTDPSPLVDSSGKLLRKPFGSSIPQGTMNREKTALPEGASHAKLNSPSELQSVMDLTASSRAGTTSPMKKDTSASNRQHQPEKRPRLDSSEPDLEPSEWLKEMMKKCKKQRFELAEPVIPRSYEDGRARFLGQCCQETHAYGSLEVSSLDKLGRISKNSLAAAEVVSQVDQKFILVKLPLESESEILGKKSGATMLVIIDQHAADERCRLEDLMRSYFRQSAGGEFNSAYTELLGKPIQFELSSREGSLLVRFSNHFRKWGLFYSATPSQVSGIGNEQNQWNIQVTSLPPSILERCRQEPKLLVELLRKEAWRLDEQGPNGVVTTSSKKDDAHNWIARFQGCPPGILDLLNSRACRSAIMFNDRLSHSECEELINRLARCAFPFQCAHGRPSMAPLLNGRDIGGTEDLETGGSFISRLRRWMNGEESDARV